MIIMSFTSHISEDWKRIQTVFEHSAATSELASEYGKKTGLEYTGKLQGLLHDLGKLCKDFNDYINLKGDFSRGEIDHAYAGAKYLTLIAKDSENTEIKKIAEYISRTILSHHGLHDWLGENGEDYFEKRTGKTERFDEIIKNSQDFINSKQILELLKKSAEEYSEISQKISVLASQCTDKSKSIQNTLKLFYYGLFERLLQSILIDADRTNTADFMLKDSNAYNFFDHSSPASDVWDRMCNCLEEKYKTFSSAEYQSEISILRNEIADECLSFSSNEVKVCRLIVPTGGGKTLSSLRFAANQSKIFGKEKIIYVAPFMSILEQNSDVIKGIAGEENFLEHYTDFEQSLESNSERYKYELMSERWTSPVISTTLVQFLNTFFSSKTSCVRRFHRLSNSVIIIDEVQAIPTNCIYLFNLAVNFLANVCSCSIVLCTATQPTLESTKYPIVFDQYKDMVKDCNKYFEKFKRTKLFTDYAESKNKGYTYKEAVNICSEKFEENGNLLFIVNTKSAAAEIYRLLKKEYINGDVKIIHLSTGMCPEHRRSVLKEIRNCLEDNEKIICVTTQLIEAGVDISFKCVFRSLAGLDNISQAAGRCNRNAENPMGKVYIIRLNEEKTGSLYEINGKSQCAQIMIDNGQNDDLLNTKNISQFFKNFFQNRTHTMAYPVDDTNLIDLLSKNSQRAGLWSAQQGYWNKALLKHGHQAFKTAGDKFKVINKTADEVIVPYRDGKQLILDLNSDLSVAESSKLLKESQKYAVSIYKQQLEKLIEKNAVFVLPCGVYALKEEFYDCDGIGIDFNSNSESGIFF